jgi:GNAT superfamily N-acetyltransferase
MKFRKYQNSDRSKIEEICINTGLNGKLLNTFEDTDLFSKLWLSAYLDGQPENVIVVEDNNCVVGYLVSCYGNYKKYLLKYTLKWYLILLFKYITRQYKKTDFVKWVLLYSWRETPKILNTAHFHFNLKEGYRNQNIGAQLLKMFEQNCRDKGLCNWYAITFVGGPRRSLKFYERFGLKLYSQKKCSLYPDSSIVCLKKELC